MDLDASAAQAIAESPQARSAAAATCRAELDRLAQVYEAFARAAGGTVFKLLGVQVPVPDPSMRTLGSEVARNR